ncbi:MAG: beta-lactamase family protein [Bacteroidales bacterium]|nr:beta-lactamase family protein [Bacteroidales bacterium]
MRISICLLSIMVAVNCQSQILTNENPQYSFETESRIKRITENLIVGDQFLNSYKKATLEERLAFYKIPGISIAVIDNGEINWARGFGYKDVGTKEPVTQNTLFQAASISKVLTAIAFMKLKENQEIDLDIDVNSYLKSWKIPSNNGWQPSVKLRELLSHTAGMTVSGFGGYSIDKKRPTTIQILNGENPANSLPIKVNIFPGLHARYSGGGFVVAQLILEDKFKHSFDFIMDSLVLSPLNLKSSTFEQPPSGVKEKLTATGYVLDYQPVNGKYDIHPEMAAAGLWTTPLELARIIIEIQNAVKGKSDYISAESANEMLTKQNTDATGIGLGFWFYQDSGGDSLLFTHAGGNDGFQSVFFGYKSLGKGVIVMINSSNDYELMYEVIRSVASEYNWPDKFNNEIKKHEIKNEVLDAYSGKYTFDQDGDIIIKNDNGRLSLQMPSQTPVCLIAESDNQFYSDQLNIKVIFSYSGNKVENLTIQQEGANSISARKTEDKLLE